MLQNEQAIAKQTLGLKEFTGTSEFSAERTDSELTGKLNGTLAGIDGEAFTVQDADGTLYTFFFSETFPRSAFDQSLVYGSPILVSYDGGFDEYGQFSGEFAVSDTSESSRDNGD